MSISNLGIYNFMLGDPSKSMAWCTSIPSVHRIHSCLMYVGSLHLRYRYMIRVPRYHARTSAHSLSMNLWYGIDKRCANFHRLPEAQASFVVATIMVGICRDELLKKLQSGLQLPVTVVGLEKPFFPLDLRIVNVRVD